MNWGIRVPIITVVLLAMGVAPTRAQVDHEDVLQAIDRGIMFLKTHQDNSRGNWPEHSAQPGGLTALCTLALLNAGVEPDEPAVARALDYLRTFDQPKMTYSVALRTMVFCAAEPQKDMFLIRQNTKWLEATQITETSRRKGAWAYSGRLGKGDNSNTQFALLALNEAERVGVDVSRSTWRLAREYWANSQRANGGWGYKPDDAPTGSMTCAGIGSSVIASGRLSSGQADVVGGEVRCCGDAEKSEVVERGLSWLAKHFSVRRNPGSNSWLLYYLYGVERVGRLTGRRFIGEHDWYREGTELLLRNQDEFNDYWKGTGVGETNPLVATSFALLFLSKGRRPVVMAKAKHGEGEDWDLHTGGVPNLTRAIEKEWLRELTWQTVDLSVATVEDLLETPVLFFSGRESLRLTDQQQDRLRSYIEQGGFIFAEACDGEGCDGEAFDRSFRELMQEIFPHSPLRLLPPEHPVWFAEGKVDPKYMRPLYGIDACCRTSVVYCPQNLSCLWELSAQGRERDMPEATQEKIEACVRMGQNVVAYATNRVLKQKLERPKLAATETDVSRESRGVLVIPKLDHGGGSDEAPNALANLARYLRQEVELRTLSERMVVPATSDSLSEYPILFAHGRRAFRWNSNERRALAEYIENGGFILADAICASPEFASAFREQLNAIFPRHELERIPTSHPMFSGEYGGFNLTQVTLNDPQPRGEDDRLDSRRSQVAPLLEGLQVDGRYAVIFSPYDLSCALETGASMDCKGYVKTDAARLGTNIILFALQQ
ncbi:MAG: DUF4159 domain-containing protein [Planctomycetota bacterium]